MMCLEYSVLRIKIPEGRLLNLLSRENVQMPGDVSSKKRRDMTSRLMTCSHSRTTYFSVSRSQDLIKRVARKHREEVQEKNYIPESGRQGTDGEIQGMEVMKIRIVRRKKQERELEENREEVDGRGKGGRKKREEEGGSKRD